jgi:dihydroxyacid dehydratase/phosphogluconate dehydratase
MVKKGIERAPHRALLGAVGYFSEDWNEPSIGVINLAVKLGRKGLKQRLALLPAF